jgi:hypothetical protein
VDDKKDIDGSSDDDDSMHSPEDAVVVVAGKKNMASKGNKNRNANDVPGSGETDGRLSQDSKKRAVVTASSKKKKKKKDVTCVRSDSSASGKGDGLDRQRREKTGGGVAKKRSPSSSSVASSRKKKTVVPSVHKLQGGTVVGEPPAVDNRGSIVHCDADEEMPTICDDPDHSQLALTDVGGMDAQEGVADVAMDAGDVSVSNCTRRRSARNPTPRKLDLHDE